jgi:hypothetical protein
MHQDLFSVRSFGNAEQIKFVLRLLSESTSQLKMQSLRKYCLDYSMQYSASFDGIISLLEIAGCISKEEENIEMLMSKEELSYLEDNLSDRLPEALISFLVKNRQIREFIDLDSFDYDLINARLLIKNSSIPLLGSSIKQFLIDMGVFNLSTENKFVYELNPDFNKLFESRLIPHLQIETSFIYDSGLTYQDFKKIQALKQEYGEQAELFVTEFEKRRLRKHPLVEKIKKISHLKVDAGYDIVSFNSIESTEFDRFIEVKSFAKKSEFYFSKNELKTAETKRGKYYLYLVDRIKAGQDDYEPIIIQDPYLSVFQDEKWIKESQSWRITPSA